MLISSFDWNLSPLSAYLQVQMPELQLITQKKKTKKKNKIYRWEKCISSTCGHLLKIEISHKNSLRRGCESLTVLIWDGLTFYLQCESRSISLFFFFLARGREIFKLYFFVYQQTLRISRNLSQFTQHVRGKSILDTYHSFAVNTRTLIIFSIQLISTLCLCVHVFFPEEDYYSLD